MTQLPEFAPELIGTEVQEFWHSCPLCEGNVIYTGYYNALVCVGCGFLISIEDMIVYEMDIIGYEEEK